MLENEEVKKETSEVRIEENRPSSEQQEEQEIKFSIVKKSVNVENIIGNIDVGVRTRSSTQNQCEFMAFISQIESKNVDEALSDKNWILAMQKEFNQFERNEVWELVFRPNDQSVIGTKWVFRNKLNEYGIITRNKTRLVAQEYSQEECIDYNETYALVPRLEAIRMLFAFTCYMNFNLYQMNVKSVFLNGVLNEIVFVE